VILFFPACLTIGSSIVRHAALLTCLFLRLFHFSYITLMSGSYFSYGLQQVLNLRESLFRCHSVSPNGSNLEVFGAGGCH